MRTGHSLRGSAACFVVLAGLMGCGGGSAQTGGTGSTVGAGGMAAGTGGAGGGSPTGQVEMFSWWTAPGEAEALQALVALNKVNHPLDRVFNAAAMSGADARALLATRLTADDPPDLFQLNAADLSAFITDHPGALAPLDSFMLAQHFTTTILSDAMSRVTVGGSVYAMPVNMHRENALFYNKQIFKDHNLLPPTTIAEFLSVCATLKAAGITPVSTAYQGWILRIMFNSLAMGSMGADAFHDFMAGGTGHDAELMAAIDLQDMVLANYIDATKASGATFGWTEAATEVKEGRAAMFFHGDWAKGYYVQLGSTPGVDFGVVGPPGASDVFWYGIDLFALPAHAKNPTGARNFLATVGSVEGQIAFNKLKGSSPIRTDVDVTKLDSEGRSTLNDLMTAKYRMQVVNLDGWDAGHLALAMTHDKAALAEVYKTMPPK